MPSHILYTCQEKKRVKKIIIIHAQVAWNQILKANKKTNWKEYAKFNDFLKVLQMFTSCKHKVIRKTFPLANFRTITVKQSIIFCFSLNLLWPSGYPKELIESLKQ